MGEKQINAAVAMLSNKGRIADEDVLDLRRNVFADGVVNIKEAEALFALDRAVSDKSESWAPFFVEAVTDFLVHVEVPQGYISAENADWLIRSISADGYVDSLTELELLLRTMEKANSMPQSLSAFALRQVEHAVVDGEGPLVNNRTCEKGIVTADDVKMLRRVLYAYSGDNGLSISREEAEVLFDINDKTVESANDPSWSDLFSKAIAFSLMAASGFVPPSRDVALQREEWLEDTGSTLADSMSSMFAGGLRGFAKKLMSDNSVEEAYRVRNEVFENQSAEAEKIDMEEANWLIDRIGRDGVLHENEKQLLEFLKKESPNLHPALKPLLDKVA